MLLFNTDNFTDNVTPSDRPTSEETTHNTSHYQPNPQETLDHPQNLQKLLWYFFNLVIMQQQIIAQQQLMMQQSLEPQKKARKSKNKKMRRSRFSIPDPNSGNEYSPILRLGFTLIKFFFFFVAGFVIAYVFTWFFNQELATSLLAFGFQFISPLIVCVSCIFVIVIIVESCR